MEGVVANGSWTISDAIWAEIAPLLPPERPKPEGGRPRMPDRPSMAAIFYVLRTGCQWKALPRAMGSGSTVHDRLKEWVQAGVFERMWKAGLITYDKTRGIDRSRLAIDGARTEAPLGGSHGAESDGSGQDRDQAQHRHRRQGSRRRPGGCWRQSQRLQHAARDPRQHARHTTRGRVGQRCRASQPLLGQGP